MPRDPLAILNTLRLALSHLFNKRIVNTIVIFVAKEFRNYKDIVVFELFVEYFALGANEHSHIWTNESRCRVKTLCVAPSSLNCNKFIVVLHARIVVNDRK